MRRTHEALKGRRDLLKAHLRGLHSVAANPATLNGEIDRRTAEIAKHEAAIKRMRELQTTVHDDIARVKGELKVVQIQIATAELEEKIKLYKELRNAYPEP